MNILFSSTKEKPEFWFPLLQKLLPAERFFAFPDINGGDIDIALVATHQPGTFANLRKLKLIQSLWMGVENIVADTELPKGVPVARLIAPGMVAAMGETVIAYVLDWHRHFYCYRTFQEQKTWKRRRQYLASDRTVGIPHLEERIDDIRAVLGASHSKQAVLVGVSEGGAMAILFAATYPERVSARGSFGMDR